MPQDLWQIRRRKKMTIDELSQRAGIPPGLIKAYELGQRAISERDLEKLAGALLVDPEDIKELSDPPPRGPSRYTPSPSYGPDTGMGYMSSSRYSSGGSSRYSYDSGPPRYRSEPRSGYGNEGMRNRSSYEDRSRRAPRSSRSSGPRKPRGPRRQPVSAARPSQLEHLKNLMIRLDMSGDDLLEIAGKPLSMLNRKEAARLLTYCQEKLAEQKPPRPKGKRRRPYLPESVDEHELVYLTEIQLSKREMQVTLFDGARLEGTLLGFSPYVLTLAQPDGQELTVNKLAIAYYEVSANHSDGENDGVDS